MNVTYTITGSDSWGTQILLVMNGTPHTITESHPNFKRILDSLAEGDYSNLGNLLNIQKTILEKFGENVSISGGTLFYKGEALYDRLSSTILEHHHNGWPFTRLVNFMERLMKNPSRHSRTQLFEFLDKHDFVITEDGHFLAYKGIADDGLSITAGNETVHVNDIPYKGRIPNPDGAVVQMERAEVMDDPNAACSYGLHAGTWEYARSFGPVLKEVKIDPADVVSVPMDSNFQKIRTMRYRVVRTVTAKANESLRYEVIKVFLEFLGVVADRYTRKGKVANSYEELAEQFLEYQDEPLSDAEVDEVFTFASELDLEHTASAVYRYHIEAILAREEEEEEEEEEDYFGL